MCTERPRRAQLRKKIPLCIKTRLLCGSLFRNAVLLTIPITDRTNSSAQPRVSRHDLGPRQGDHAILDNTTLAAAFKINHMYRRINHAEDVVPSAQARQDRISQSVRSDRIERRRLNHEFAGIVGETPAAMPLPIVD